MKRIVALGIIFTILAASATAQGPHDRIRRERIQRGFECGQLTRPERFHLQKNQFRYKAEQHRAFRDGRLSPYERRRLHRMKRDDRRDIFRYKHNGRRRVI